MSLASWGRLIHRRRGVALAASLVVVALSIGALGMGGKLLSYQPPENAESTRAFELVQDELSGFSETSFSLVFSHATMSARDAAFQRAVEAAVAPLLDDPRIEKVTTPYRADGVDASLVSEDGHRALVVVGLKTNDYAQARAQYASIRDAVASPTLEILAGGDLALNAGFEQILAEDLQRAEVLTIPLTLILLLLVFGTLVAALLPLGVGLTAVAGGVAAVFLASRVSDVSVYAVNIVTLIGLGVAIDYSLFIVNRFREELSKGRSREDALARTMQTAGRAVAFSGLTVAVGLLGLTFYTGMYFASMGLAGALVVAFAVLYALVLLPAVLAFVGHRIEKARIPFSGGGLASPHSGGLWHRLAMGVMRRPVLVLVATTLVVLVAATPFLGIQLANATEKALPETAESRQGTELIRASFADRDLTTILVIVDYPGDPLTPARVASTYDLSRALARLDGVEKVQSIVNLDAAIPKERYQDMYANGPSNVPAYARPIVDATVGESVVVLRVLSPHAQESEGARALVERIRAVGDAADGDVLVTGQTAFDVDTLDLIRERTPWALAFIVVATYVLLLLQTGSLVLPAKAVVMNVLSIAASFGALVWVFQEGNLSGLLGFTPAPIDPSLPILLFCIVFGLSMDYEVLLLSRMHEEYRRTGDNTAAVAEGLERSGRLITSAAAIMVLVFAAFATARVTIIQAIGFGLALAIALDATLVRALIVPAAMRLMGDLNWWAPGPLKKLQAQLDES